jgi:hypothetical protein
LPSKVKERIVLEVGWLVFDIYPRWKDPISPLHFPFPRLRALGLFDIAHYTNGNVLAVKKLLGHKQIRNTMKYIGMIHFKDDEFDIATAITVDEAKTVLAAGYDYVTEKNGIMLFRKPKRFKM